MLNLGPVRARVFNSTIFALQQRFRCSLQKRFLCEIPQTNARLAPPTFLTSLTKRPLRHDYFGDTLDHTKYSLSVVERGLNNGLQIIDEGKVETGIEYLNVTVSAAVELLNGDHFVLAPALIELGHQYKKKYDYVNAIASFKRALRCLTPASYQPNSSLPLTGSPTVTQFDHDRMVRFEYLEHYVNASLALAEIYEKDTADFTCCEDYCHNALDLIDELQASKWSFQPNDPEMKLDDTINYEDLKNTHLVVIQKSKKEALEFAMELRLEVLLNYVRYLEKSGKFELAASLFEKYEHDVPKDLDVQIVLGSTRARILGKCGKVNSAKNRGLEALQLALKNKVGANIWFDAIFNAAEAYYAAFLASPSEPINNSDLQMARTLFGDLYIQMQRFTVQGDDNPKMLTILLRLADIHSYLGEEERSEHCLNDVYHSLRSGEVYYQSAVSDDARAVDYSSTLLDVTQKLLPLLLKANRLEEVSLMLHGVVDAIAKFESLFSEISLLKQLLLPSVVRARVFGFISNPLEPTTPNKSSAELEALEAELAAALFPLGLYEPTKLPEVEEFIQILIDGNQGQRALPMIEIDLEHNVNQENKERSAYLYDLLAKVENAGGNEEQAALHKEKAQELRR